MQQNDIYYVKEIYMDDYNSLQQSIIINCKLNLDSNGMHARNLRSTINPNLHLVKVEYLNINMEVINNERK